MKTISIRQFKVRLFVAAILFFIMESTFSQDFIRYKNGHSYHVKIVYMNMDTLKYQVAGKPSVTLTITRADLDSLWMEKPYEPPPPTVLIEEVPLQRLNLKNELYTGYGLLPLTEVMVSISPGIMAVFSGEQNESKTTSTGTFFLGYNRSLAKWVSAGIMVGYQRINCDIRWSDGTQTVTIDNVLVMVSARFNYIRGPWVTGYSGISAGIMYLNERDIFTGIDNPDQMYSTFTFSPQITLFGLRVGRQFGGFVEFGLGYMGVINLGLSYKL